jgi:uncharacterized repeat protein (TIGR02543 family)
MGYNYVLCNFVKKRSLISVFTFILIILGLFAACPDPNESDVNYTVKFETNGGSPAPKPQSITNGKKVVTPPAMTKTGYSFSGWYKDAAFTNLWNFAKDTVSGNITLYAKWDANYHTVEFETNGGTPAPDPQNISQGGLVIPPPAMTKTGYGFGDWYKEADCTNQWDFATDTVSGNITLYAKWDLNYHTVNFDTNDGSPAPAPQSITNGDKIVMPPVMTKTGYSFGGWYKDTACTNPWDFAVDTVSGNITLYAKWDFINHTVNFEANGGSPAPNQQNIAYGGKVVMPPAMTKTGYSFGGWYKDADCNNQWSFVVDTVTGDITLYAKWLTVYTVTFNADNGTPPPPRQRIIDGDKVIKPENIFKEGYNLEGWYKDVSYINLWDFENDTVTDNIILFAKWGPPIIVSGNTLAEKLQWLSTNATSNSTYILEVTSVYEDLPPQYLYYIDKNNITIRLKGIGSSRTIALSGNGSLFSIGNGVTLILDENLILSGRNNNTTSLVQVNSDGKLVMNQGVEITGNTSSSYYGYGGGVHVWDNGTFTMNGGKISGNTASNGSSYEGSGGGVFVNGGGYVMNGGGYVSGGTFTMNGGEISDNTSSKFSNGGGVYVGGNSVVRGGTFTMTGAKISGNSAGNGGGVSIAGSGYETFTMSGGEISGNSAFSGGGVYIMGSGYKAFTMSGGEISGNSAVRGGGGVYLSSGTITMNGGKISGNSAYSGGGVLIGWKSSFTMSDGEISSNTASYVGGGVAATSQSTLTTFTKSGGIITGYTSDTVNGNVVKDSGVIRSNHGHAVFVAFNEDNNIRRESTAGPGDNLDARIIGTAGGWED